MLKYLFVSVNSIALLANCADLVYFQFTLKRTTADVFHFFGGEIGNDLGRLLPLFIKDYWYVVVIWLILTALLYYLYEKTEKKRILKWDTNQYIYQAVTFLISVFLFVIAYRGGIQLKPISIVTAGEYTSVRYVPLVVNTPFTILKTLDLPTIEPDIYFKDERELKKHYNPLHPGENGGFKKLNVFIIALESFSKEYVGALNKRSVSCTPFLDSLIGESLTFSNGFSNGKKSMEGIPAIVSSIPTWMNEAYITSPYGSNQTNSLPSLLKEQGYYTAFFHGGTNGTMGFDAYANLAGFDNYFGRKEYNNENDYDGNWGIWDEEFFQYTANTINKKQQPFFATLFTLTSHHPYTIPNKYRVKFKEGNLEIEKSISYSDYSLKKFFETAKKMPWFNNTLFVLCADHTGVSWDEFYMNRVGNYTIPIVYYLPRGQLKGQSALLTQQIDIMPSVLDYLNYSKPYFAFGNSVFDTTITNRYALTYNNDAFQLISKNYSLGFNGTKATDLYNYTKDSLLKYNLIVTEPLVVKELTDQLKAIIQTYQQSLIYNTQRVVENK
ncbi:MAG: LTA synthase family protein [Bacteroidota bacterium]